MHFERLNFYKISVMIEHENLAYLGSLELVGNTYLFTVKYAGHFFDSTISDPRKYHLFTDNDQQ